MGWIASVFCGAGVLHDCCGSSSRDGARARDGGRSGGFVDDVSSVSEVLQDNKEDYDACSEADQ